MPGCAIRVIVSDDTDDWWDERVGSEVLGFALWERVGKEAFDGEAWGKDGWMKRTLLYYHSWLLGKTIIGEWKPAGD